MAKTPEDSPTKVGDRVQRRGRLGSGVVATLLARPGWMEIVWDDGSEHPKICHQNELFKVEFHTPN